MRRWHPDGKPSYEATFLNNELSGKEVVYDKTGKPICTINYLNGGIQHGAAQFVHPDNQKMVNIQYYYGLPVSMN
jgi:antitoxin component YwqK of YwqJK toxin-antitoxin module